MIKDRVFGFVKSQPQFVILIFLLIVLSATTPKFASAANFINILKQVSVISIIGCGLTLVVISGSLDLSIGSVFSLLSVVAVTMQTKSILFAILLPVAFAVAIGLALLPSLARQANHDESVDRTGNRSLKDHEVALLVDPHDLEVAHRHASVSHLARQLPSLQYA